MDGYAAARPLDYAAIVVLQVTSLSCHHRCSTLFKFACCSVPSRPGSSRRAFRQELDKLPSKRARSIWETLSYTTGRLNRTERTMRKTSNALLGILTMMSGAILAVPTEAAERYIPGVHLYKTVPEPLFSYPYGGTHLRVDYAKRRFGYPYVGFYYGSYYAPGTTMTPGITALPTIGNAAATAAVFYARPARPIGSR